MERHIDRRKEEAVEGGRSRGEGERKVGTQIKRN